RYSTDGGRAGAASTVAGAVPAEAVAAGRWCVVAGAAGDADGGGPAAGSDSGSPHPPSSTAHSTPPTIHAVRTGRLPPRPAHGPQASTRRPRADGRRPATRRARRGGRGWRGEPDRPPVRKRVDVMAVQPEGAPCWADAMFNDIEGAKRFYGEVLGWTFGDTSSEYGNYTQAYVDGKAVAAVVPPMPGQEGSSQWCLYIAAEDAAAAAARIREHGGELLMNPMPVGDFGTMCLARDPGGVVFGVWQAGTHEGFQAMAVPGAYCWAEVYTRDPDASDAFFPAVFSYRQKQLTDEMDFRIYDLGEQSVLGRMRMTDDF